MLSEKGRQVVLLSLDYDLPLTDLCFHGFASINMLRQPRLPRRERVCSRVETFIIVHHENAL